MRRAVLGLAALVTGGGLVLAGCQVPTATGSGSVLRSGPAVALKSWTMPNLVGAGLQVAQDKIQSVTGDAVFFTSSHDVSGRGRHQIIDSDWKVCSQNVPAGGTITVTSKIDFGVVKTDENCP